MKAFHRDGAGPVYEYTGYLEGHETTRLDMYDWLYKYGFVKDKDDPEGTTEGLVMVEPFPDPAADRPMSLEFPAVLIICPIDPDDAYKYNRFVPFTRIP